MPTSSQYRAARALLNLSLQDVSDAVGIGIMAISDLEQERTQPKASTIESMRKFYEGRGVDFPLDGGIRISHNTVQIYDGPDCYFNFMNEAHSVLAPQKGEILFSGADERRSPDRIIEKFRSMREDGITMRNLIRPGDDFIMGQPEEYKWMPEGMFVEGDVKVIFADRVGWLVSWLDNPRVIMIKDPIIAQEAKRTFEYFWSMSEGPTDSSSKVRY